MNDRVRSPLVTAMAIGMAAAIGLGIARFAYALVLPVMRDDLNWSYSEAGWLNTTNALGYLLGALLSARLVRRFGAPVLALWGVAACMASLAACGLVTDFLLLNVARVLAGVGGAFAFVAGGALAAALATEPRTVAAGRSGLVLGIYYAMPGLGIAVSGLVVPATIAVVGPASWPVAWWTLALICVPGTFWLIYDMPISVRRAPGASAPSGAPRGWILSAYLLFGAGYIGYMTFMVAHVRDGGGGPAEQGAFWATIGAGAIVSAWAWRRVLDRMIGGRAFALLCALCACGAAVPVLFDGMAARFVSAALFGCVFFSVVASTTAFVRRNDPPEAWAAGIGAMTVAFGIGQIIGPVLVGWLNDRTGDLQSGLALSALLLFVGAIVALPQKDRVGTSL